MGQIHIRNVGDELVRRLKIEAIRRGCTLRDVVIRILGEGAEGVPVSQATKERFNGDNQGRVQEYGGGHQGVEHTDTVPGWPRLPEPGRRMDEESGRVDVHEVREDRVDTGESDEVKECSDCGDPLIWNKQMKWWQCTGCPWHGKRER